MSNRVSHRKCVAEQITPAMVQRALRAGPLTTTQICERLGLSKNGTLKLLETTPGIQKRKRGAQTNLWSLE